jgi:hypothetical protein
MKRYCPSKAKETSPQRVNDIPFSSTAVQSKKRNLPLLKVRSRIEGFVIKNEEISTKEIE